MATGRSGSGRKRAVRGRSPRTRIAQVGIAACTASAVAALAIGETQASAAPPAAPPSGSTGTGGAPGSSTETYASTGALTHSSGTATLLHRRVSASGSDESAVLVTGGSLTLRHATITISGSSKSSDESSFYGLDAGVLANGSGRVHLSGGSVTTTGDGANALFAYGSSAIATASNTTLTASGQYAHGAMASGGGRLVLRDVRIVTHGASSAAVATDRGGGTVTVTGGRMMTRGMNSPGIYSTGDITVTGATMLATGAEAGVVEGDNSITAIDDNLTGTLKRGIMLYQSMSGDAADGTGAFTMRGGSLTAKSGPAFYVTNERAVITLSGGAKVTARSGVLLRSDSAGTGSGNTGAGITTLKADDETLRGNIVAAGTGSITASLVHSTIRGVVTGAALDLNRTSVWTVTGDSTVTSLSGLAISGRHILDITGNGHTVTYVSADNPSLDGRTYTLAGGGTLTPAS